MVGLETPVIRATRRPAIRGLLSVVVSFSSAAAVSPGAPFGQIAKGRMASSLGAARVTGAAQASRQSRAVVRMTSYYLARAAPARASALRDSLSVLGRLSRRPGEGFL